MAITLTEKVDSRETSGGTQTRRYHVQGTDSETAVLSALLSGSPGSVGGLIRDPDVSYEPVWVDTDTGDGLWECSVQYKQPDESKTDIGDVRITWSSRGGSQHVTQALEHIQSYNSSGAISLLAGEGAINYDGQSVQGVDIPAPVFAFQVTKRFASGTAPSLGTIYGLTAKTNNATFAVMDSITGETISLSAGECLFEGAEKSGAGDDGSTEIAFSFAAGPNKVNFAVGPITVASKKGWEYLSVEYTDKEDGGRHVVAKQPSVAHVLRVFEAGTFSWLGL